MLRPDDTFADVYIDTPTIHRDDRGSFTEWFKTSSFTERIGHPFALEQANISVSRAGVIRGLHFADVPPGQAKWVHCAAGTIIDVIVDVRVGSPTFGVHTTVELSADNRRCVYIPEGFAHGFAAITDATVIYLTSSEYDPQTERGLDPFDEHLGIQWPVEHPVLSDKDTHAPSLDELKSRGLLPQYDVCVEFVEEQRDDWAAACAEAGLSDTDTPGRR